LTSEDELCVEVRFVCVVLEDTVRFICGADSSIDELDRVRAARYDACEPGNDESEEAEEAVDADKRGGRVWLVVVEGMGIGGGANWM